MKKKSFIQSFSSSILCVFALFMLFLRPVSAFTNYSFAGNTTSSYHRVSPLKTKNTSSATMPMVCFQTSTSPSKTATFGVYKDGVYCTERRYVPCNGVEYSFAYSVCEYGNSYELYAKMDYAFANDYISGKWRP